MTGLEWQAIPDSARRPAILHLLKHLHEYWLKQRVQSLAKGLVTSDTVKLLQASVPTDHPTIKINDG
jgi:hypothetical protein